MIRISLIVAIACQIAFLSGARAQSAIDDQRMLDYLVESSAAKETSALAAYRTKNARVAIDEMSELIRIYQAIVSIKSLADAERQYWSYMLVVANGRLGRVYGWVPDEKARINSYEQAIQHARTGAQLSLRSIPDVEKFVESIDNNDANRRGK